MLVISETYDSPSILIVQVALHDALVERLVQALESLPLRLRDVHIVERLVLVLSAVTLIDEQFRLGDGVVVHKRLGDALAALLLCGLDCGEGQLQAAVDCVLLGGLPLEDVRVGAVFVGRVPTGEDEPIVAVREVGENLLEHHLDAIGELEGFHLQEERLELALRRVFVEQFLVRSENVFLDICQTFVQCAVHQASAIHDKAVKDEEPGLLDTVGEGVPYKLPVRDCLSMESFLVFGEREMQVSVRDEPVVILAVDQIMRLAFILVFGGIE